MLTEKLPFFFGTEKDKFDNRNSIINYFSDICHLLNIFLSDGSSTILSGNCKYFLIYDLQWK